MVLGKKEKIQPFIWGAVHYRLFLITLVLGACLVCGTMNNFVYAKANLSMREALNASQEDGTWSIQILIGILISLVVIGILIAWFSINKKWNKRQKTMKKKSCITDNWVSDMEMKPRVVQVKIDRLGQKIEEDNDYQNLSQIIDELQWKHDRIERRMVELLQAYGEIEKEAQFGITAIFEDLKADLRKTWEMHEK